MKKIIFIYSFFLFTLSNRAFSQEIKVCKCIGFLNTSSVHKAETKVVLLTEPFEIPCIDNPRAANYTNGGFDGNIPHEGYRGDIDIQIFEHFYKNNKVDLDLIKQPKRLDYTVDWYIFNPSVSFDAMRSTMNYQMGLKNHGRIVWVSGMSYKPLKYSGRELVSRLQKKSQYMKNEISEY